MRVAVALELCDNKKLVPQKYVKHHMVHTTQWLDYRYFAVYTQTNKMLLLINVSA
jgi:hypothetical protein